MSLARCTLFALVDSGIDRESTDNGQTYRDLGLEAGAQALHLGHFLFRSLVGHGGLLLLLRRRRAGAARRVSSGQLGVVLGIVMLVVELESGLRARTWG